MKETNKKCGFFASVFRYNTGLIAEIAGPATGMQGLRARRISFVKGKLTMWERKFNDITFEEGEMKFLRVYGYNYPCMLGGALEYGTYVDVLMNGTVNRIVVRTATVQRSAMHSENPFPGSTPVVSGWVKRGTRQKDSHFDDPICPDGYEPLIEEYVEASFIRHPNDSLKKLGITGYDIERRDFLMKKPLKFDKIEAPNESAEESIGTQQAMEETKPESSLEIESGNSKYKELVELKSLCDSGIITKEDFENKKNEILFGAKRKSVDKGKKLKIAHVVLSSVVFIAFIVGFILGLFVEYVGKYVYTRWYTLSEGLSLPEDGFGIAIPIFIVSILTIILAGIALFFSIKPHKKKAINILFSGATIACLAFVTTATLITWCINDLWADGILVFSIISASAFPVAITNLILCILRKE